MCVWRSERRLHVRGRCVVSRQAEHPTLLLLFFALPHCVTRQPSGALQPPGSFEAHEQTSTCCIHAAQASDRPWRD